MNYWKPYENIRKKIKSLIVTSNVQQCGAQINVINNNLGNT
jgi:hypothetical protein